MQWWTPHILVGGAREARDWTDLDAVIDLTEGGIDHRIAHVLRFPLADGQERAHAAICGAALELHAAVQRGEKIGVHCHAGQSRTAAVAFAYLLLRGLSWQQVLDWASIIYPEAQPHHAFRATLADLRYSAIRLHTPLQEPWQHPGDPGAWGDLATALGTDDGQWWRWQEPTDPRWRAEYPWLAPWLQRTARPQPPALYPRW